MAAGKKEPKGKKTEPEGIEQKLRDEAEMQITRLSKASPDLTGQTPDELIHELRVHQVELEMQAEQLRVTQFALEESLDRYIDLYDFAPIGYFTLNDRALITEVNLSGATLLGVVRKKLVNHGLGRFIAPGDHEVWDLYFIKVRQSEGKQICNLSLKRGDGSVFPARLEGVRTTHRDGSITVRLAISDISDIWQIEAVRESEGRYRAIYDQSPIAIELYDASGRLKHINQAGLDLFGIENIQAIRNFSLFNDPNINDEQKEQLRRGETVQYQGPFDFEKVKALDLYPTSREGTIWLDVLITPLGNRKDSVTGFLVQVQDITGRISTEQILHESETKHRALFEAIVDTIFLVDQQSGSIVDVNPAASRVYGFDRDEFTRMKAVDISAEPEQTAGALEKPVSYVPLRYHHRKDGSVFPVEISASVFELCGKSTIIAVARDITKRKRLEEALHQVAWYTRSLIDVSPDPLVTISHDGKITDVNAATEQVTGYSRDYLVGTDFLDYFTNTKKAKEGYRKVFDDGIVRDYPLEIRHRDGTITSVLYNAAIYRDEMGTVQGVFAAARDITDRIRAEEALLQLTDRLSLATRAGGVGIWGYDVVTNTLTWDDQMIALYGITREQFSGEYEAWKAGVHPDDQMRGDAEIQMALRGEREFDTEFRVLWPDGSVRNIRALAIVQRDAEGKPLWMIGTNWDITAQKNTEGALSQANRKLNLLSSITRHDINNQLTIQMGYLDVLEDTPLDHSQEEYFQKVSTAAKRISAMIRFTKEYEDIGVRAPSWQDCRTQVDTAAKQVPLGSVMVKNDLPSGAEVFADPLVVKVCYNLMDNAVRYGGKITTIRFSGEKCNDEYIVVCEDDGDGIPTIEKEKFFERGFGQNTGLGLALSREILDITGIAIKETGEPVQGARFEITVPKGKWR